LKPTDPGAREAFPKTRWSLVVRTRREEGGGAGVTALAELCETYWYPVYSYIRRAGNDATCAEDLTQGFFEQVISKELFPKAEQEKGKLRSFLLRAVQRFVGHEYEKAKAQKRGGGRQVISFDHEQAEEWFADESNESLPPDRAFEKRWALTLLDNALSALAVEQKAAGRERHWGLLSPFLAWNAGSGSQDEAAAELGVTIGAFRAALLRLRRRYRIILQEQIGHTVDSPDALDEEIRHLFRVLSQ